MRFAALVALAVVASTVPSLAAPAPYSLHRITSRQDTSSTDDNTVVDTSVRNGFATPRIGTVILPGESLSLGSKRDTTSDIVQAIAAALNNLPFARKRDITADVTAALQAILQEGSSVLSNISVKRDVTSDIVQAIAAALNDLPSARKRDITADITAALQAILQEGSSVLSNISVKRDITSDIVQAIAAALNDLPSARKRDITADITAALQAILQGGSSVLSDINVKRDADSILPVEERSTASTWLKDIGSVISLGAGVNEIVNVFDGSNSTKRDLDQTPDGADVNGALGGPTYQFEDRSFTIPSSVSSILGKTAGIVSAGGTIATILSDLDGSSNSTKRELDTDLGHTDDQKRASSDIESILQQIIVALEGAEDALNSTSTSTSTKRSTSYNDFFGLTDIITPEQLDELS
ncbi:uncharacterized protein F5147DRAFT_779085 [Suillus discolor]|uniref:Uncharacterized protein n=1 Tax=Suillus discolor TaxID=1912936 RepID=A0A9P7EWJ7_9AGAM|nr:uncharacterized protein F5147DRAFT_779085 [Suillus discolor]KAG2094242.1 hypothetical protein F5147DRAFT_779085 [Suillus discolor]